MQASSGHVPWWQACFARTKYVVESVGEGFQSSAIVLTDPGGIVGEANFVSNTAWNISSRDGCFTRCKRLYARMTDDQEDGIIVRIPEGLHTASLSTLQHSANTMPCTRRFCYKCSHDLFDAVSTSDADHVVFSLVVPRLCPSCDDTVGNYANPGMNVSIDIRPICVPIELYNEYRTNGAFQLGNPKRNTQIALVGSIEGADIAKFTVVNDALLMLLPLIPQLSLCMVRQGCDEIDLLRRRLIGTFSGIACGELIKVCIGLSFGPVGVVFSFVITCVSTLAGYKVGTTLNNYESQEILFLPKVGRMWCGVTSRIVRVFDVPPLLAIADNTEGTPVAMPQIADSPPVSGPAAIEDAILAIRPPSSLAVLATALQRRDRQEQNVLEHDGVVGTRTLEFFEPVSVTGELDVSNIGRKCKLIIYESSRGCMQSRSAFQQLDNIVTYDNWGTSRAKLCYNGLARQVAPLIGNAIIYNTRCAVTMGSAVGPRLMPNLVFDSESDVAKRMMRCCRAFRDQKVTEKNVKKALRDLGIDADFLGGKRAPEIVRGIMSKLASNQGLESVMAMIGKLEVSAKSGKPARLVINEQEYRQVAALMVVSVFEQILFGHCGACSIKHKTRKGFCDEISAAMSDPPKNPDGSPRDVVGVEIDQTKFDSNITGTIEDGNIVGILALELEIMDKIHSLIPKGLLECNNAIELVRAQERKPATALKFKQTKGIVEDEAHSEIMSWVLKWVNRTSGNRGTSARNFFAELNAALSAHTLNPEIFWSADLRYMGRDNKGRCWFDFMFIGLDNQPLYFRFWVEGDDFAGQADKRIASWRDVVMANFAKLGLLAKLVYPFGTNSNPARLEFCGIHTLMINGRTFKGLYLPDIIRTLCTSGVSVNNAEGLEFHAAVAAGFYMKAIMYANTIYGAALYFERLAQLHEELANQATIFVGHDIQVHVGAESVDFSGLRSLLSEARNTPAPDQNRIVQLVTASVGASVTKAQLSIWEGSAASVEHGMTAAEVYSMLPNKIQFKLLASFGGKLKSVEL